MKLIRVLAAVAGVSLLAMSSHGAMSQMARTIRFVVPFPPGGSGDDLARLLVDQIGRAQGRARSRYSLGELASLEMQCHARHPLVWWI